MNKVELASKLMGIDTRKREQERNYSDVVVGVARSDSKDGYVEVSLEGETLAADGGNSVRMATTSDIRKGDSVYVTLRGAPNTARGVVVTGAAGGGDRTRKEAKALADAQEQDRQIIEDAAKTINSVKAQADAHEKLIQQVEDTVKADSNAHEAQIADVKSDIDQYKKDASATYSTKAEVDEKTGAITRVLTTDYTKTKDLAGTQAIKDAKASGDKAQSDLGAYRTSNDQAVAAAKKAGTDAQSQLLGYKTSVQETYAEKTELQRAVNQLSSTMTSNYSAFTSYRTSNDAALSKAQTSADDAQNAIKNYKTSNDKAVADAKSAGTTAQSQLSDYKASNDQAVAAAKKAGTDAQTNLNSYRGTTDQRLDELKNIADNAIETYSLKGVPTTSNAPAKDWTTDALKSKHAGDLYIDADTGYSYRWSGTAWVQIKDSEVTKALKELSDVKTTYTTKSELSATDKELLGKISDTLTSARSYTDSSMEQEVTNRNAAIKAKADSITSEVSSTYTRSETFAAYQTDADGRIATANSNASSAVTAASRADATANAAKSKADDATKQANLYEFYTDSVVSQPKWIHLGTLTSAGNASNATIAVAFGDGYNGDASQNSALTITIRDGWQQTPSATAACGVSVMRENCDSALVDVLAQSATVYDVWVYVTWNYPDGSYSVSGNYASWQHSGAMQKDEPATSATQVKQDVAYRLADATAAQTMATKNRSSITQLADKITATVSRQTRWNDSYASRTSTLEQTAAGLQASISNTLKTANAHADGKVAEEVTNRNAAIKAATDGITSSVARNYVNKADAAQYATKSSLEQIDNKITSTVSEQVQTNSATASRLSKVEQDSESLTASFKATQSTANAAKQQADMIETLVHADVNGVIIGKSADGGKTYPYGYVHIDGDSFDILDANGNILATFSDNMIKLGSKSLSTSIDFLNGLMTLQGVDLASRNAPGKAAATLVAYAIQLAANGFGIDLYSDNGKSAKDPAYKRAEVNINGEAGIINVSASNGIYINNNKGILYGSDAPGAQQYIVWSCQTGIVTLQWKVWQPPNAYQTLGGVLPENVRPNRGVYAAGTCIDEWGYIIDHTAYCWIGPDGHIGFKTMGPSWGQAGSTSWIIG